MHHDLDSPKVTENSPKPGRTDKRAACPLMPCFPAVQSSKVISSSSHFGIAVTAFTQTGLDLSCFIVD